ncbi:ribonuclease T2 [Amyelois transitella]|uniref:ribonuclease T2 n=1 Tax=Amyelois transitella TaxID=680683 RepID=UPI00067E28D4|nr:ribonuclease T2 [Amyelois transitella]XP_013200760.1 ribonuclease T2 [Amyelois transitella]
MYLPVTSWVLLISSLTFCDTATIDSSLKNKKVSLFIRRYSERHHSLGDNCVDNNSPAEDCFQHFKLAIFWSPGYAFKEQVKNNAQINKNKPPEWIIHGLWPSMNGRNFVPKRCDTTNYTFNAQRLKTNGLMNKLERSWYSILKRSTNIQFWKHEFENHGSCATRADPIRDDVDYFRKAIELYYNVNRGGKLTGGEFKPGDVRKLKDVKNIINRKIGAEVKVNTFKHENQLFLTEVYICYNLTLNLINCPYTSSQQNDLEKYVIYLADFK